MTVRSSKYGFSALILSGAICVPAFSQANGSASSTAQATQSTDLAAAPAINPDDKGTYATGKPLEMQSKEGFWGHLNPLARKKWVKRQVDPIKDRTNELDQLQAKNRNDIRDVDSRSQAGIRRANDAAALADQHAQDAGNRANSANTLAGTASSRTETLNGTVSNLDQYQTVSSTAVQFAAGRTTLGPGAKSSLDALAASLGSEKGYIIEVQGYSKAGVQTSQKMADTVVRYLVTEHQVPVYRIYKSGLGKVKPAEGETALVNGVRVTLLHNSLATMGNTTASTKAPAASKAYTSGTSNTPANQ